MHDRDELPHGHAAAQSLPRPSLPDAAADPLLAALDQLVRVGRSSLVGWVEVMTLIEQIREQRTRGINNDEYPDNIEALISAVARLQLELTTAAAQLRRAAAQQLRSEGMSTTDIARTFGVTRQRVAHLLAQ